VLALDGLSPEGLSPEGLAREGLEVIRFVWIGLSRLSAELVLELKSEL
jgi:hypothetical protein